MPAGSGYDGPPEPAPDPEPTRSPYRVSTTDRRALKDAIRTAVKTITGAMHEHLTRDELEHDAGLYLADEQDAENVAEPTSSLIARRTGPGLAGNPDLADAIGAAMALATYLGKQFALRRQLRAIRKGAVEVAEPAPPVG